MHKQSSRSVFTQLGNRRARVWGLVLVVAAFTALAWFQAGGVEAAQPNQTIPPRTPLATPTDVPTVTPTSPPAQPPTNTPVPPPTNTPVPPPTNTPAPAGPTDTPQPGATNTPAPTNTPTASPQPTDTPTTEPTPAEGASSALPPAFALQGQMALVSGLAIQGQEVELQIAIVNPGDEEARNVMLRDELPATLEVVSVDAPGGSGETNPGSGGTTILLISWPSLAPGEQVSVSLIVRVNAALANGTVIDNLAVAWADNAAAVTVGLSLGTPPRFLPIFN